MNISHTSVTTGKKTSTASKHPESNHSTPEGYHIVALPEAFASFNPIVVNNESLSDLEGCFSSVIPVSCIIESPLFSGELHGSIFITGKEIAHRNALHIDIPLIDQTRAALALCKAAYNRTIDYDNFDSQLHEVELQGSTKEDIINAMFDVVEAAPLKIEPTSSSSDSAINNILDQVNTTKENESPAQKFVDSISGIEMGHKLKMESASVLIAELQEFIDQCTSKLYNNREIIQITGWCTSLYSLIKKTRARNKQHLILVSTFTLQKHLDSFVSLVQNFNDSVASITILEEVMIPNHTSLIRAADSLSLTFAIPVHIQPQDETLIPVLSLAITMSNASSTFLFSGYIAVNYVNEDGETITCWKPAALGYLEGTIINAEKGWNTEDQLLKLPDQDIIIINNRCSQATKEILTSERWNDLRNMRINAVNSIRNTDTAMFMPVVTVK